MPRPKIERVRLSLELSPKVRELLEELRTRVGADTLTEVIRRAIALYSTMAELNTEGVRFILRGRDGREREFFFPRDIG